MYKIKPIVPSKSRAIIESILSFSISAIFVVKPDFYLEF